MIKEQETYYKSTKDELLDLMEARAALVAKKAAAEALAEHMIKYRMYNKKEAAEQLHVSPATITKWCASGKIKTTNGYISGYEISRFLGKICPT